MMKKQISLKNTVMWLSAILVLLSLCACGSMEQKRDQFLASGEELL